MASDDWVQMPLGKFVTLQRGHDLPDSQRAEGSVPVIGSFGVTGWHDEWRAPGPGVTVGRSGASFGVVTYSHTDFWPLNTALYVKDFHGNDPRFAYYLLRHFDFTSYNSGSAQPSLNRNYVHPVPVRVPPLDEQRRIAHILGTLDDKIELNRRMNVTLEEMARALFKSWFVDFDPVRAKAEGRDPGLPPHLADLFPDRLVDSELGEIPEGWEVKCIADLAEIVGGGTPSTKEPAYWDDGVHHWATPKDLSPLDVPVLLETERRVTDAGLAKISTGLLPVGTVLLSSRAPIGYSAVTEVPVAVNQGFIAMKPKEGVPSSFLLRWTEASSDVIVGRANGSTFLEISKSNFRPILVAAPGASVLEEFDRVVGPLHRRVVANVLESSALASLRDALLPRLISGRIRTPVPGHQEAASTSSGS
ncbi:MAG TPA: restriction endonuclease subunit S [Coriobacteriia bacterium]|nr:restriction endonuclease subunit S [Coriobacteriia bacterium]